MPHGITRKRVPRPGRRLPNRRSIPFGRTLRRMPAGPRRMPARPRRPIGGGVLREADKARLRRVPRRRAPVRPKRRPRRAPRRRQLA